SVHMVARKAILKEAYAVVLAHNHPGGKCSPSMADRDMTKSISEALDKLGIALTDHVIVATGECYSMKENTVY
ncbi:MAG: JAB domain-containing protein, partial [Clostridia bacterium]|nr:JAB domain-containing protein [Clostridia bacterium]